jgi:hypothetical protein
VEKYLRLYAEPEVAALDGLPGQGPWENVMVIPACDETSGLLRPPPPCGGRSLMILVINESVSASHRVSLNNQALAAAVQAQFELQWQSTPELPGQESTEFRLSLLRDPVSPRDVLLVDRFNEGRKLPAKGGVGHARKIGADLAASLIHRKRILSPWIHCTDADVQLPETYFTCSNAVQDTGSKYAALVYPFHHCDDKDRAESSEVLLATQLYELSLRYYVAGMKFARSPYAFHTIGSTMAVSAVHYAKVRGFPKREAGEDFYLLNKLAKVGQVLELGTGSDCEAIEIESRRSDRVPFGTGAAVNKITGLADPVSDFRFYDPAVFELLRLWLQSLPAIWQSQSTRLAMSIFPGQSGDHDLHDKKTALLAGLMDLKTDKALEHAFRQSGSLDQFTRQIHTWFDAFRTLKLIHYLRDSHLPAISYARLEANQTYSLLLTKDPDLLAFHEHLGQYIRPGNMGPE